MGFGDAGYQGVERRAEIVERFAEVRWYVAAKRSKVKAMAEGKLKEATQALEKAKAQLRAYVEHPFHVVKNLFNHRKTRYRAWPRTPRSCTSSSRWPTWCWPGAPCGRKPRREPPPLSESAR